MKRFPAIWLASRLFCVAAALAGIDHPVEPDHSGIWARSDQNLLRYGILAGDIAFAVWEGGESRVGHTAWQSIDSVALAGVAAEAGKRIFGRLRPSETNDPNQWFQGGRSFPSGEVAEISGIVTPYVLEYGAELADRRAGRLGGRHRQRLSRAHARQPVHPRPAAARVRGGHAQAVLGEEAAAGTRPAEVEGRRLVR
jgi:hypothetical protein